MTKKLPLILATMLAALALPILAADTAPAADAAAPAADAAAPAADAAAADAAAPAPKAKGKKKAHHGGKKHHHKKHSGEAHDSGSTGNTPQGSYRKSYDENSGELPKADCAPCEDLSPKAGPAVAIGQKAP